jgi:serine/threonine protein kinase
MPPAGTHRTFGRTICHSKILSKLGEGGLGAVHKAEDVNLKGTVALEFLLDTNPRCQQILI